jgi:hypothetical protein
LLRTLSEIARRGLAADCYGWDPLVVRNFAARDMNVSQDLGYLAGVVKSGPSLLRGIKDAARIAVAGNRFARQAQYLLHATVDEMSEAAAEEKINAIEKLALAAGGTVTEPSVPRALRGTPFSYPNKILGSAGERWVPTNALCPHSRAPQVLQAFRDYMASQAALTAEHRIEYGIIFFAVGNNTMTIEPLFYWPDARLPSHDHLMQPEFRSTLPYQPPNPAATEARAAYMYRLARPIHTGKVVNRRPTGCWSRSRTRSMPRAWSTRVRLASAMAARRQPGPEVTQRTVS